MRSEKEIEKEISDMKTDLKLMNTLPKITEQKRRDAIFCQEQVIKALKWTVNK